MHSFKFFRHNTLDPWWRWMLGAVLWILLGACSSLEFPGYHTSRTSTPPPQEYDSPDLANPESDSSLRTLHASYRPPSTGNTVVDLPDAFDYSVKKNRQWVDDLETAPEWTQTPLDRPAPPDPAAPLDPVPPPAPQEPVVAVEEVDLPWIDDMDRASLIKAIQKQLNVMESGDLTRRVRFGSRHVTRQQLVDTLHAFRELLEQDITEEEFSRRLNEQFEVITAGYPHAGRPVVFTGYYTPIIPARREKTPDFVFPLYQKPAWYPEPRTARNQRKNTSIDPGYHLTQVHDRPLLTREDIDGRQALSDQQLEVAWLRDDLERYFLHIQGSGYLAFPDGTLQAVQYMGSNHFPYRSIGKQMIQDGVIEPAEGSMQGIKEYFREHPEDIDKYLFRNHRYIFFRIADASPLGSGGAELVAGRSIATDKSLYPAGGLACITVDKPILNDALEITGWQKMSRFVVDQDTGSAIKGPGRVDLYFGIGEPAGAAAGHYKRTGHMIYLLKK